MTVANGWGLSCLTNVGVEAEEPKLEGQRFGGGFTTPVIDLPPSSWPSLAVLQKQVEGTPLVCCVPVGVCLQQRSRVSTFDFAITNLIPFKTTF